MDLLLDERLKAIVSEIDCEVLADIGCDHGKIAVAAILDHRAQHVYAVDISEDCIKKAIELAKSCGVADNIDFIIGDGFKDIHAKLDQAVIAGLGGHAIANILMSENAPKRLILSSNSKHEVLRSFLNTASLFSCRDYIVTASNFHYPIIVVEPGIGLPYSSNHLYWGKNLPPTDCFIRMLKETIKRFDALPGMTVDTRNKLNSAKACLQELHLF
ncbi:MAG: class I SAM-dependent methyltransferase [Christensenellaceae bacterium]|jgi:tRNA (adenine22-N1)-methyltransferase|nr:class I SAM-dependent methyltransferase [Christensenellaceae bacterium]